MERRLQNSSMENFIGRDIASQDMNQFFREAGALEVFVKHVTIPNTYISLLRWTEGDTNVGSRLSSLVL